MLNIKDILCGLINIAINIALMLLPCWTMLTTGCYSIIDVNNIYIKESIFILVMEVLSALTSGIQIAWILTHQSNKNYVTSSIFGCIRFVTNFLQCISVLFVIEISGSRHDYRFPLIANIIWSCLIVLEFFGTFIIFIRQRHNLGYLNV
jgi:hypothetical protein